MAETEAGDVVDFQLSGVMESLDSVPESMRSLYSERDGKFECTGIQGLKTQADIDRIQSALRYEKDLHRSTKKKLEVWKDFEFEDVQARLDRLPELESKIAEAEAEGKLTDSEIQKQVEQRLEGTLKIKLNPIQRENETLRAQLAELQESNGLLIEQARQREIRDAVHKVAPKLKVQDWAYEDLYFLAERELEVVVDEELGTRKVLTKDSVGVTPGLDPEAWLLEKQPTRPGWFPQPQGGGARGNDTAASIGIRENPYAREKPDLTAAGRILKEHGPEKLEMLARAAGKDITGKVLNGKG
jgi:hypothetical protein